MFVFILRRKDDVKEKTRVQNGTCNFVAQQARLGSRPQESRGRPAAPFACNAWLALSISLASQPTSHGGGQSFVDIVCGCAT